jgi:hypothetical protein
MIYFDANKEFKKQAQGRIWKELSGGNERCIGPHDRAYSCQMF